MTDSQLPNKVLIVDSDASITAPLVDMIGKMGIELFTASDLQTALYRFNKQFFRVIFVEHHFPELDGLALIQKWRQHELQEKQTAGFVLMVSGTLPKQDENLIKEMGRIIVVNKPLKAAPFVSQLQKAFANHTKTTLTQKVKADILAKLQADGDINAAIKQIQEFKGALGDEYLPMLMQLYEYSGNFEAGYQTLKSLDDQAMNPLKKLNLMGRFSLKIGNFEEARRCFEQADKLAPQNLERLQDMSETYIELDEPEQAVAAQKTLLELNPDQPDMKFDFFKTLEGKGYENYAQEFCREVSSPKEVVRYFNNKGVAMAHTMEPLAAVDEYQRAISYFPQNKLNYLIHFNIALAYLRTKQKHMLPQALKHLQKATELKPDFDKAQQLLSKLQSKAS